MTLGIIPNTPYYPVSTPNQVDANGMTPERVACYADPNCDTLPGLIDLLRQDITQTGAGWVSDASGASASSSTPTWVWYAGAGLLGFIALSGLRGRGR